MLSQPYSSLKPAIVKMQMLCPMITICSHVGDQCLTSMSKSRHEALVNVHNVMTMATEEIANKSGLPFAEQKFVVSSHFELAKRLQTHFSAPQPL